MENPFFEQPILNSPYEYPAQHWELVEGQLTDVWEMQTDFETKIECKFGEMIADAVATTQEAPA